MLNGHGDGVACLGLDGFVHFVDGLISVDDDDISRLVVANTAVVTRAGRCRSQPQFVQTMQRLQVVNVDAVDFFYPVSVVQPSQTRLGLGAQVEDQIERAVVIFDHKVKPSIEYFVLDRRDHFLLMQIFGKTIARAKQRSLHDGNVVASGRLR